MVPTRNHEIIREWAKAHNAVPAEIKPLTFDSLPAMLTFLLGDAGKGTPDIHPIGWESFFARFDLLGLAFAFDEATPRFDIVKVEKRLNELSN